MGKTPTPLRMLVHPDYAEWEEFTRYRTQGHVVHTVPEGDPWAYDLVLGPQCSVLVPEMRRYLALTVKSVQQARNRAKREAKRAKGGAA